MVPHTYKEIATWEFGDWVFGQEKVACPPGLDMFHSGIPVRLTYYDLSNVLVRKWQSHLKASKTVQGITIASCEPTPLARRIGSQVSTSSGEPVTTR